MCPSSLGCRGSCFRVVFLSPNSSSSSCFLCSSDFSCSTSCTSSILSSRMVPLKLHCLFWSCSVHEFLPHSGSHWPSENRRHLIRVRLVEPHMFRRCRTRWCVQRHHEHAFPPAHWNPLAGARVLDVLFLRSEHDDDSRVDNRTHGGQRSCDVSVRELHVALLAFPNEFQSRIPCQHTYRTTVCCRRPHRLRRLCSRNELRSGRPDALGSYRIDSDLLHLLHHVSTSTKAQKTSNLLLRLAFVVSSVFSCRFACISLRFLNESVCSNFTNFPQPVSVVLPKFY